MKSSVQILEFQFDDVNVEKLWTHGLRPDDLVAMLEGSIAIARNRKNRRATHLVVGRDAQGRCIAAPIEPTHNPTHWRPVTAWFCKPQEEAKCP